MKLRSAYIVAGNADNMMGTEYKSKAKILAFYAEDDNTGVCVQFDNGIIDFCDYEFDEDDYEFNEDNYEDYVLSIQFFNEAFEELGIEVLPHDTITLATRVEFIIFTKEQMRKYIEALSIFDIKVEDLTNNLYKEMGIFMKNTMVRDRIENAEYLLTLC